MVVAVYGASPKPDRVSNRALHRLVEKGHEVLPVNPAYDEIEHLPALPNLADAEPGSVDTVTLYVGPKRSSALQEELLHLHPRRIIMNPGAENPELAAALEADGIEVVEACTLVLLSTDQF